MPNTPKVEILLKLGGRALQRALMSHDFFCPLQSMSGKMVIVHGGGSEINDWATRFGVASEFINGQRKTTPELLEVVQAALCGSLNPKLVWRLEELGISAVGLSGISGSLLKCEIENPALGLVGRVTVVNSDLLLNLAANQYVPVIAPVGVLADGQRCNVNADLASCAIAAKLKVSQLIFLTDQPGILDEHGQKIDRLTIAELDKLEANGTIKGGMFVKSRAIKEFLEANPTGEVLVASGMDDSALIEVMKGHSPGTLISGAGR
jgi:acetylglutamate kinase